MTARTLLTADTTFYVSPSGDDGNDGLSESNARRTIQGIMDLIHTRYDHGGVKMAIQLETGTDASPIHYDGFCISGGIVGHYNNLVVTNPHSIELTGDIEHPNRVVIDSTVSMLVGKSLHMGGMTFTSQYGDGLSVGLPGSEFVLHRVNFGACGNARIHVFDHANVRIQGDQVWSGNAMFGIYADILASVVADIPSTILHSGASSYAGFVVGAARNSVIGMTNLTFAPSSQVTGLKFKTKAGGVIDTVGQVANSIFPGTVNGINLSGGIAE